MHAEDQTTTMRTYFKVTTQIQSIFTNIIIWRLEDNKDRKEHFKIYNM